MVNPSDFDGTKEMSVAFHFVRQLMLKLASMFVLVLEGLCVVLVSSCAYVHSTTNLCIL